jgi:hypothetical protein
MTTNLNDSIPALLASRQYNAADEPPEEQIVWRIQFNNIGSLGNFAMITGQPKAGKSRYLSAIIGSGISRDEIFRQQVKLPQEKSDIAHWDTEQSRHDYHRMMKLIKKLAGIENFPVSFNSYHCRRDNPRQIMAMIEYYLTITPTCGLIVLDGLLDMIDRFNDEGESKALINFLKRITDVYNILVIGVLHRSRTVDKTMGHLGSAADRAAQSVLIVEKNIEGSNITYILKPEYLRSAESFDPISIFYNKAINEWQLCDTLPQEAEKIANNKKRRAREYDISEHTWAIGQIFNSGTLLKYSEVITGIRQAYGIGDTYAKQDFLPYLIREGLIFHTGEGYTNRNQARLFVSTSA